MFNYLKWELKDYVVGKYKWLIAIGITLLAFIILPYNEDGLLNGIVSLMLSLIILTSIFGAYFAGAKHAVDTFNKKTFLLESMIPIPAKKILLAKYILGIIINAIYILILTIIIAVLGVKGIGFDEMFNLLKGIIDVADFESIFRVIILLICTSIAFLSVVILSFVGAKAMNPNGKHDKIVGFVLAVILLYIVAYTVSNITIENQSLLVADLTYIIISAIAFFITAHLVENKLEIYN